MKSECGRYWRNNFTGKNGKPLSKKRMGRAVEVAEKRSARGDRVIIKLGEISSSLALSKEEQGIALSLVRYYSNNLMLTEKQIKLAKKLISLDGNLPKKKVPKKHYVYIMKTNGFLKIGRSTNPRKRRNGLQTSNPEDVVLYAVSECESFHESTKTEKFLHELFEDDRLRGEWFNDSILSKLMCSLGTLGKTGAFNIVENNKC